MQRILDNPARVLDVMRDVAASEIVPRFQKLAAHEIDEKRPGDLVTIADRASEAAFELRLPDLVPGSRVLGEEMFETNPDCMKLLDGDGPVWIVDPVDGTHNFAHGRQPFTVIVALVQNGTTRGGWIIDPMQGDAAMAVAGEGAVYGPNDALATIKAPGTTAFADTTMTAGIKLRHRLEQAADEMEVALPNIVERYRCVGREYMDIANGTLDMARYGGRIKPWDHAAGCLIVAEAGGRADDLTTQTPYAAHSNLQPHMLGIVRPASLWQPFRGLMLHADGLSL